MRLSSDGVFFFPKPYPNTINKKNTHTKKKENPHSIVIIIEFLSIFFVAFCNIHCYYLVRLDLFLPHKKAKRKITY